MTRKQTPRGRELGMIHILKAKLGLTDEQYRDVLWSQARVDSAKNLDEHGRRKVVAHLRAHLNRRDGSRYPARPNNADAAGRGELRKIEALLADAGLPWSYAEAVMRSQTRGRKERLEFCTARELVGILAALERQALKRLAAQLQDTFGGNWESVASSIARELFGFDASHRDVSRYSEIMSKVLRWWRGEPGIRAWPVDVQRPACCAGCYQMALVRSAAP